MLAWYFDWPAKALDTKQTLGSPAPSKAAASCMMQVVHEPQSANARTADLHSDVILFLKLSGHGRENVGFE